MNTFGNLFTLTSFGESHGRAIGGVVDGMPAGIPLDMEYIQRELNRRRPGQSSIVTSRKENDRVEFLSGIFEGKTTGTPIGFLVYNENQHSSDYDNLREVRIMIICGRCSALRMPIIHTPRNTGYGIIGEVVVLRLARR